MKKNKLIPTMFMLVIMLGIFWLIPGKVYAAEITNVSVTITEPVAGDTRKLGAAPGNPALYTSSIWKWTECSSTSETTEICINFGYPMTSSDTFVAGKDYAVWIDVTANAGNNMRYPTQPTVTVNGSAASFVSYGEISSDTIHIVKRYTISPFKYSVTVQNDGNGTASASTTSASNGTKVTLTATAKSGYMFKKWDVISGGITIMGNEFTMGNSNVIVKALFESIPKTTTTYNVTVNSGTTNKSKPTASEIVTITASKAPDGKVFDKWITSDGVTFANANNTTTTFTMPSKNVTVTATYKDLPSETYAVNILNDGNGTASANVTSAKFGDEITLTEEASEGFKFKEWLVTSGGVTIENNSFIMPKDNITIEAIFERIATTEIETPTPEDPKEDSKFPWWILLGIPILAGSGYAGWIVFGRKKEEENK